MPIINSVTWEGADGSVWDLLDLTSPVQLVALDGLGMPTFTNQFSESGTRDGRRYEGTKWNQSITTMTVMVGDILPQPGTGMMRKGEQWRAIDRAWRESISPELTGKLTIDTDTGGRRWIFLRLDQPLIFPSGQDPALLGQATYTMVMTADDSPWWHGPEVAAEYKVNSSPAPFFVTSGSNLFYISEAARATEATLYNPGDRPAYPKWYAKGPFTGVVIGMTGETVTLPFSRSAGQTVYVDSFEQTIVDQSGASLWSLMGFSDPSFGHIMPREEVSLITTMTGSTTASAIGVTIEPLYNGPW